MSERSPHTPPSPEPPERRAPELDEWEKQIRGAEGGPSQWGWGEPASEAPTDPNLSPTPGPDPVEAPTAVLPPRPEREREEIPFDENLSVSYQVEKAARERHRGSLLGLEIKRGEQSLVIRDKDSFYLDVPQLEKKRQLLPRYNYPDVPAREGFFTAPKKGGVRLLRPSKWSRSVREETVVQKTKMPRLYNDGWGLTLKRKTVGVKKVDESVPAVVVDVMDAEGNVTGVKYFTYNQLKDILDGKTSAPGLSSAPVTGLAWRKPKPETDRLARTKRVEARLEGERDIDVWDQLLLQQKELGLSSLEGLTWTKLEKGEDGSYKRFKHQVVQDRVLKEMTMHGSDQVPAWMVKVTDSKGRIVRRELLRVGMGTKGENYEERILKRQLFEAKADTGGKDIKYIIRQRLLPEKKKAALDFFANAKDVHWEIPDAPENLANEALDARERKLYHRYLGWMASAPLPEFETRKTINRKEAERANLEDFIKRETAGLEEAIAQKVTEEVRGVGEATLQNEIAAMQAKIKGDRRAALWLLSDVDGTGKVDVEAMAELLVNKPEGHKRLETLRYIIAEQGLGVVMEQILSMQDALKTHIDKLDLTFDDAGSIRWLATAIADQRYGEDNKVRDARDKLPKGPDGKDPDFVNIFDEGVEAQHKQDLIVAGLLGQIFSSMAVSSKTYTAKTGQVNREGQEVSAVKVSTQVNRDITSKLPDLVRQPVQRLLQDAIDEQGRVNLTGEDYIKIGELLEHAVRR